MREKKRKKYCRSGNNFDTSYDEKWSSYARGILWSYDFDQPLIFGRYNKRYYMFKSLNCLMAFTNNIVDIAPFSSISL